MTQSENRILPLQKLGFAPPDYAWEASAAAERIKDAQGWAGLAAYSLWVDTSADSQSLDAYPLVVVDILEGEPRIVPGALDWAREEAGGLEDEARETVQARLGTLEERLKQSKEPEGEPESSQEPRSRQPAQEPEESQRVGKEEAERIVEKLSAKGSLLPAWGREPLVGFIAGLSTEKTLSDGFERFSPARFFQVLMESLPAFIPSSEVASPQAPQERSLEALGRRIAGSLG